MLLIFVGLLTPGAFPPTTDSRAPHDSTMSGNCCRRTDGIVEINCSSNYAATPYNHRDSGVAKPVSLTEVFLAVLQLYGSRCFMHRPFMFITSLHLCRSAFHTAVITSQYWPGTFDGRISLLAWISTARSWLEIYSRQVETAQSFRQSAKSLIQSK
ncbi:hypothetical protein DFJ73DRAFT_113824 [Zopfochytrium polystomum]|nr:hypothetical protein DFJ73DRAFT_113824 [Zopfochytrium polystomum]